jgi:hypothetical protein
MATPGATVDAPPSAPTDTDDARTLARELRIPARRLSLAVERGELRNYDLLGGRPRYSRAEVMEVIRKRNLTPAEREAEEQEAAAEAAVAEPNPVHLDAPAPEV